MTNPTEMAQDAAVEYWTQYVGYACDQENCFCASPCGHAYVVEEGELRDAVGVAITVYEASRLKALEVENKQLKTDLQLMFDQYNMMEMNQEHELVEDIKKRWDLKLFWETKAEIESDGENDA